MTVKDLITISKQDTKFKFYLNENYTGRYNLSDPSIPKTKLPYIYIKEIEDCNIVSIEAYMTNTLIVVYKREDIK